MSKRVNMSISIDSKAADVLDSEYERWKVNKKELMSLVLNWYGSQPETVRAAILDVIPAELRDDARAKLLKGVISLVDRKK